MNTLQSLALSLIAFASITGAAGCAADAVEPQADLDETTASELVSPAGPAVGVPNPSGSYFASVSANGSGCPKGTWDANISPDGEDFVVTFNRYQGSVAPGQSMAIADCTLGIDLHTPSHVSFAVRRFTLTGYAILDQPGMRAAPTAKYYFQGNPLPARESRSSITGPYADEFVYDDQVGVVDLVWSPCGMARRLNAQTRLVVQNNPQRTGEGKINVDSGGMSLRLNLAWRRC